MPARSCLRSAFLAIALVTTPLATLVTVARADDATRIRIQGRVLDRAGRPLPKTWVVTQGARVAGTFTGPGGRYELDVPGGTMEEIARTPLLIRVQARCPAWSIGVAAGAPELAFELRIVTDAQGARKLQVRSNDAMVAATLANAAVLENGTRAAFTLDFVGAPGHQADGPVAAMGALEEVMLSPPTAVATADPVRAPVATASPAPAATPVVESAPSTERPRKNVRKARPAAPEGAAEVETEMLKPRVYRPGDPAAEDAALARRMRKLPRARVATQGEIDRALSEMGLASADLVKPLPQPTPFEARNAQPAPPAAAVPAGPRSVPSASSPSVVPPAPRSVAPASPPAADAAPSPPPSTPPATPVTTAPGGAAPIGGPTADTCACRVQGTVEVVSDKPLPERMQVTVYAEDRRKTSDTVELFMGSPRQFDLKLASCGTHALKLQIRAKQKYVLTSTPAVVDCAGGGYRQVRFVLEPLQRWTSASARP